MQFKTKILYIMQSKIKKNKSKHHEMNLLYVYNFKYTILKQILCKYVNSKLIFYNWLFCKKKYFRMSYHVFHISTVNLIPIVYWYFILSFYSKNDLNFAI